MVDPSDARDEGAAASRPVEGPAAGLELEVDRGSGEHDGAVVVDAPTSRPPIRSLLPRGRAALAWLVFTLLAVALDGWTGLMVGVGIAAALLAGARPRTLAAAGAVCSALVPVWVLSRGPVAAEDVTPALVTESLVPHHLAFAALALLVTSIVLQIGPNTHTDEHGDPSLEPSSTAGPLGGTGPVLRWAMVAASTVLALAVCVVAWSA